MHLKLKLGSDGLKMRPKVSGNGLKLTKNKHHSMGMIRKTVGSGVMNELSNRLSNVNIRAPRKNNIKFLIN
jgi:hypothetical protein